MGTCPGNPESKIQKEGLVESAGVVTQPLLMADCSYAALASYADPGAPTIQ